MSTPEYPSPKGLSPFQHLFCCGRMPAAKHEQINITCSPVKSRVSSDAQPRNSDDNTDDVNEVLTALEELSSKTDGNDLDLAFLRDLLKSPEFQSLLRLHESVSTPESREPEPVSTQSVSHLDDVFEFLESCYSASAKELLCILENPFLQCLLEAHDSIARKQFLPDLPDIPYSVDEDEESVKIVKLVKGSTEPLGATIHLNEETGIVRIARIMHGGAADRSGLIHVGDEVKEVNGIEVHGKPADDVIALLSHAVGPISLKLVPAGENAKADGSSKMRVRAHFSYSPREDPGIPCREVGLAFTAGDILHLVSTKDALWWQAHREGDVKMRAGLIPSRQLQERRNNIEKAMNESDNKENKDSKNVKCHGKFSPRVNKKWKKKKHLLDDFISEAIADAEIYEPMTLYQPTDGHLRPIVLIGAPGVGRTELRRRLTSNKPDIYKEAIPHTSRAKRPAEVDGKEYIFISKADMEKDIENKLFVEHGEYKGNYYGTSLEQIKYIIHMGHICVVCPRPQALKILLCAELKPYVIFIKPPSLERLKATRRTSKSKAKEDKGVKVFTEDELKEMISCSSRIEKCYIQYFDHSIINDDLAVAADSLFSIAENINAEPKWLPTSWIS